MSAIIIMLRAQKVAASLWHFQDSCITWNFLSLIVDLMSAAAVLMILQYVWVRLQLSHGHRLFLLCILISDSFWI